MTEQTEQVENARLEEIKAELDAAREDLNRALDQVGERWETRVYSDGLQWTVRQLVAHLADAEKGHLNMAMGAVEGKDTIPEDFDIERYNASRTRKNAEKTVEESRESLAASREALNEWLFTLSAEQLNRKGRHATLRMMTVEQILRTNALHERMHTNDLITALEITLEDTQD